MANKKKFENVIIKSRIFSSFIGQLDHKTASSRMSNNAYTVNKRKKKKTIKKQNWERLR